MTIPDFIEYISMLSRSKTLTRGQFHNITLKIDQLKIYLETVICVIIIKKVLRIQCTHKDSLTAEVN